MNSRQESRRTFLKWAALLVPGGLLAACGAPAPPGAPAAPEITPAPVAPTEGGTAVAVSVSPAATAVQVSASEITPIQGTEISGAFSEKLLFNYSEAFKGAGLIPSVIDNSLMPFDKVLTGRTYLKKLSDFLQMNPSFIGPTFTDLTIVSSESFPVSIEAQDTALTVLNQFLRDSLNGSIASVKSAPPPQKYILGTINTPHYDTNRGGWFLQWELFINTGFPFGEERQEDHQTRYSKYSDLQIGLKYLHEYIHFRQDQTLLTQVLRENSGINSSTDPGEVSRLITDLKSKKLVDLNQNPNIDRNIVKGQIAFNEEQADLITQLILEILIKINNNVRIPGTEDDPFPTDPNSRFRTFQRAVYTDRNPWDPVWLSKYVNWPT